MLSKPLKSTALVCLVNILLFLVPNSSNPRFDNPFLFTARQACRFHVHTCVFVHSVFIIYSLFSLEPAVFRRVSFLFYSVAEPTTTSFIPKTRQLSSLLRDTKVNFFLSGQLQQIISALLCLLIQ